MVMMIKSGNLTRLLCESDFSFLQLWLGVKPGLKCFHFAEIREQVNIVNVSLTLIVIMISIIFNTLIIIILTLIIINIILIIMMTSLRRSEALQRVKSLPRNPPGRPRRDFTPSWLIRRFVGRDYNLTIMVDQKVDT